MGESDELPIYVIYENPSDYPGKFVVRRQLAMRGRIWVDLVPLAVVGTVEEARGHIPEGCVCLSRDPSDDPVIVETWL